MAKKKTDKSKLLGKILAGILAALTLISVSGTCIYAIISSINA
jgi:hypothetical protein